MADVRIDRQNTTVGQTWYANRAGQAFTLVPQAGGRTIILDDGLEYWQVSLASFESRDDAVPFQEGTCIYVNIADGTIV